MTTTSDQSRRTPFHWWLLAAAVISCVFLLGSAWSLVAQLAVLVAAVHRLTRRPSKQEAVVLWAAVAVIVVTLIAVAAISIATASVSGSFTSTTVPWTRAVDYARGRSGPANSVRTPRENSTESGARSTIPGRPAAATSSSSRSTSSARWRVHASCVFGQ